MRHVRHLVLLIGAASIGSDPCFGTPMLRAQPPSPAIQGGERVGEPSGAPNSALDLTRERALVDASKAACNASDYATARAKSDEAVTLLLARPDIEQDAAWLALLDAAGLSAWDAQDTHTANAAWQRVLDVRSASLADDHPELQAARLNLAMTIAGLGDLAGARALQQAVLDIRSRTLPDDHPDQQAAREHLAVTLALIGDLAGARALQEKVLDFCSRTLADDHPDLQWARANLALSIAMLGDLAGARALHDKVLEVFSRTLPDEHPDLQWARSNVAGTIARLGDLAGARVLHEKVLEVNSRTLPDEHPDLLKARENLAGTIAALGDLAGARALFEPVLEVRSRTLPDDHPDLQSARADVALTIKLLGDLAGARVLQEKVLEVNSRTLPDEHPALQSARQHLAITLADLGDLAGARALFEKALEVLSRTLPDEHNELQAARANLALTLQSLGDLAGARSLQEKALEVASRTLPEDHPDIQAARFNLAATIQLQGDLAGARALFEKVLEVCERTLPDEHPVLQATRGSLAVAVAGLCARARGGPNAVAEQTSERAAGSQRCTDLIGALCRGQVRAARDAIVGSSGREAQERCASLARTLDLSLSFADGFGVFEPLRELEPESFVLAETTRGAAIASADLSRTAAGLPKYAELRAALREASDRLARLAQQGTTSAEFDRARAERESAERDLVVLARELSGGEHSGVELDVESLAARLEEREVAVGFRRFKKTQLEAVDEPDSIGRPAVSEKTVESLCAFVVRSAMRSAERDTAASSTLTLVDLGPIAPIEAGVRAWRDALGIGSDGRGLPAGSRPESTPDVRARGAELRERIFDPLLPALGDPRRIVFALDDVLHLVPLDALPVDADRLVGDRWRIETRATLTELLDVLEPLIASGPLVAFGDVEYGAGESPDEVGSANPITVASADVEPRSGALAPRADEAAGILRGSPWSDGFSALPATGGEVRGIARCFADQFGADAEPVLAERDLATRDRLLSVAPRARWLHIATHGWFAPESIRSWNDSEPLDEQTGLGARMSGAEQVKGMSPMLLCGLALAGANLPENEVGRAPGLVTADELSSLDLTGCELAVLSACDTNVGERRAGQGVASLQRALQMAGARSVITSLWKVPDEATKELMLDFYRRLWVEKKPKHQALWEAKTKLREAKDERGEPKYTTRDWAAWVLTGDPG